MVKKMLPDRIITCPNNSREDLLIHTGFYFGQITSEEIKLWARNVGIIMVKLIYEISYCNIFKNSYVELFVHSYNETVSCFM